MAIIFVMGAPVLEDKTPGLEFKLRLDKAIEIFKDGDTILVSGRTGNTLKSYPITQSECGKNYLVESGINPQYIIIETISVETAGNFAFSASVIFNKHPEVITIISSEYVSNRVEYITNKVFGNLSILNYKYIRSAHSDNKESIERETKALNMYKKLLGKIDDGNYLKVIEVLLLKTPFYIKNYIGDKNFFDEYWQPGGWENYIPNKEKINKLSKE